MALTNPKLFGLHVKSNLNDLQNPSTALQNLGVNPLDLSVIRGSAAADMEIPDWVSFSRLKSPIYKILDRFNRESNSFSNILEERAGIDQTLFGNLSINGSVSGSAIRYRYLDGNGSSATVRFADISTSRASAWSSADPRANDSNFDIQKLARISFGARVGIVEGGKLIFGTQSTVENFNYNGVTYTGPAGQPRLQTTITPEPVEFESEEVTSIIKCKIGTQTVFLYAMKGIPIVFKGRFSRLVATVTVDDATPPVSWKIVQVGNENLYSNYANRGDSTSSIYYRSPVSRDRLIKIYKNPDNIKSITITRALIGDLPAVQLNNCTALDFAFNNIKTLPDFNFVAPSLKNINLRRNPLRLSDIKTENKLNAAVLQKFPQNLTVLRLGGCFSGSVVPNTVIADRFKKLTILDLDRRQGGTTLHRDDDDTDGDCPLVSDTVTEYNIARNSFQRVPQSFGDAKNFYDLPKLVTLDTYGNTRLKPDIAILGNMASASANPPTIQSINFSANDLPFPTNLSGVSSLITYRAHDNDGGICQLVNSATGAYIFDNCNSLEDLILFRSNLGKINFPASFNNSGLTSLNMSNTNVKGGKPGVAGVQTLTVSSINIDDNTITFTSNHGMNTCDDIEALNSAAQAIKYAETSILSSPLGNTKYFGIRVDDTTIKLALSRRNAHFNNPMDLDDAGSGTRTFQTQGISTKDEDQERVIYEETFEKAVSLKTLQITSSHLLTKPIDEKAFRKNLDLEYIRYQSNRRTSGSITNLFDNNDKLKFVYLANNAFEGTPPNFAGKGNIRRIELQSNKFDGNIPAFSNLNLLVRLYLHNNKLTSISEPGSLASLQYYQAHNNEIAGQIPDFSGCPNLRTLTLNNNQLSNYKPGAFKTLYKIKFIDLSFNALKASALNQLLIDLKDNWEAVKRGGVTINLKNQENDEIPTPFGEGMDAAQKLVNNGWSIGITGGIISED